MAKMPLNVDPKSQDLLNRRSHCSRNRRTLKKRENERVARREEITRSTEI
jgi:hypothetical protein